ncbi:MULTISPECIES: Spy/CpxP family protein refolding chaperone [unclassified Imperialibacter]|uniref:Spy/CpxP family protein refolding chaperone n=1 Tax=unclassified Imperialibacter TaxID=2629706 RepID=UPI001257CF7B|nr:MULTISPECIES: hypothetical protein [unclassified Imperialibacter]CAD5259769.1 conserved exported hypothetical protein [Imperialibacter sp. 75]CAD5297869.1 conserved exported hypothetical protein [Imperialibacter sp. 89]VVT02093.1 conserved exported hypothetical protein [Imperialibacter sp. EC-SDR9]
MKKLPTIVLCVFVAFRFSVSAQQSDPFTDSLYEPDLIVKYKKEISLSFLQESKIMDIYESNSYRFSEKKKEWSAAMREFQTAISGPKVDYTEVDRMFTNLLSIESEIKKIKLRSLTEIKNELTEEQQENLDTIKKKDPDYDKAFELEMGSDSDRTKISIRASNNSNLISTEAIYFIVGDDPKITIAGKASLLKDIDPNDIAAVSVEKGQSAIEKYGDSAKGGVITIKIKSSAQKKYFKN